MPVHGTSRLVGGERAHAAAVRAARRPAHHDAVALGRENLVDDVGEVGEGLARAGVRLPDPLRACRQVRPVVEPGGRARRPRAGGRRSRPRRPAA